MRFSQNKIERPSFYVEYFEGGKAPNFKEFEAGRRGRKRNQMQMIRVGDLVSLRYQVKTANDDFEIYNAVTDPKEIDKLIRLTFIKVENSVNTKKLV